MSHTFTIQALQPSGDLFMLEWDEGDNLVAAIPNVNQTHEELLQTAREMEEQGALLDAEWYDNAEWARAQTWGYPLTTADL